MLVSAQAESGENMYRTYWWGLALFLGIGCVLIQALNAQTVSPDSLVFAWDLHASTNDGLPQRGDKLDLRADRSFVIRLGRMTRSGTWNVREDSLHLAYELVDLDRPIDSVHYTSQNNVPVIRYFYQGKEVASQSPLGIESERFSKAYGLSVDARGNVRLIHAEETFLLSGRGKLLVSPFSFEDVWRGILGLLFLLMVCYAFSSHRRSIDWKLVGTGLGMQIIFALLVLKVPVVNVLFSYIAKGFVAILSWTDAGSTFLFETLMKVEISGYIFAFQVLPVIVFFSALTSLFYYLGVLQRVVFGFAWVMKRTMRLSGAESLAATGNIFLGQTEAPLLIKPYLPTMTRSEIMSLMTGGMATIAGAVFGAYVGYLGGDSLAEQELFATHLLTASIMSAPAAIVAAKMLLPERESINEDLQVPKDRIGSNVLDAITNGATEGLRLAVNVGVMLLVFIALIKGMNVILTDLVGKPTGLNDLIAQYTGGKYSGLSLEYLFGLLLSPVAWLLGVPKEDIMLVGQLLGEKTVANEFVAYTTLGTMKATGTLVYSKSVIIATYALCGFANFASIGIQIGGIGALAPSKRVLLSELGLKALLGGTVAAFFTAVLAGMLTQL